MKQQQQPIRDRFERYLGETGARYTVIGKNLDIPFYILGKFRRGMDIWDNQVERLSDWLEKQNY